MTTETITATPALADLPARDVLTLDGAGAPEDPSFAAAIRALYAVRAALGTREDVPLEGSYSQDGDPLRFDLDARRGWHWRLLHHGPYEDEGPSLAALYAFAADAGRRRWGGPYRGLPTPP